MLNKDIESIIEMIGIGMGTCIGALVMSPCRLLDPVGWLSRWELFVNSPAFGAGRGPNTRLYTSRKTRGYKRYINNHTLVCQY